MAAVTEIEGMKIGVTEHVVQFYEHDAELAGVDAFEFAASFAAGLDAPGRARRLLAAALRTQGYERPLVEQAMLVASELAANAVLHARSGFSIDVRADADTLRVAVADARPPGGTSDAAMVPRRTHGLGLIDAVALRWGVRAAAAGKVVWAELAC
jgi:anti-sigma regulatory factor (Ser/Thr protein kinase)